MKTASTATPAFNESAYCKVNNCNGNASTASTPGGTGAIVDERGSYKTPVATQSPSAPSAPRTSTSGGITKTVYGANGTFGQATANSDGTVTVSNNLGSVTLNQQQMQRVAAGDMGPLASLMGQAASAPVPSLPLPKVNSPSVSLARAPVVEPPDYQGPTLAERIALSLPSIPQPVADAVAGFGDGASKMMTFGAWSTEDYRRANGLESYVNKDSNAYDVGKAAGAIDGFFAGNGIFNSALKAGGLANTVYHFTSAEAAANIAKTGAVANPGLWGEGVYGVSVPSRALATITGARNTEAVVTLTQQTGQIAPTGWPFVFRVIPK